MEGEGENVEQVDDEVSKRKQLTTFVNETRVLYDKEMDKVIDEVLINNGIVAAQEEELTFPRTEAENNYNHNMQLIKHFAEEVLNDVRHAKYNLSRLKAVEQFKNVELSKPLEYYYEIIDDSYKLQVTLFELACNDGFSHFKFLVDLAKKDRRRNMESHGEANIVINYFSIALGPVERISGILEVMKEKLEELEGKDEISNNMEHNRFLIVEELKILAKQWVEEDKILKEKQFQLFDVLAETHIEEDLEDGMRGGLEKYHDVGCEMKFAVLQTKIYCIPQDSICKNLTDIKNDVAKCHEALSRVAKKMLEFQKVARPVVRE